LGSLFFIISDSLLGLKKVAKIEKITEQYVMGTYLSAQILIVLGWILATSQYNNFG
jgi:hypothetical protein